MQTQCQKQREQHLVPYIQQTFSPLHHSNRQENTYCLVIYMILSIGAGRCKWTIWNLYSVHRH